MEISRLINKNTTHDARICLLENEIKQQNESIDTLKKEIDKTNAIMLKYCDVIKTLEYQSTKQRERICLLENEKNKCGSTSNDEILFSIRNDLDDVIDSLMNDGATYYKRMTRTEGSNSANKDVTIPIQITELNKFKKIETYKLHIRAPSTISSESICANTQQVFSVLKSNGPFNTIKILTVDDHQYLLEHKHTGRTCASYAHLKYTTYRHKFDVEFLTSFPNLKALIVKGYGFCGLLDCLVKTKHTITEIELNDYYLESDIDKSLSKNTSYYPEKCGKEIKQIENYCKTHNIKFILSYSMDKARYRTGSCTHGCHKEHGAKYLECVRDICILE